MSIGLPVRDGARYLDEAIRSILNQTYQNFELVISDNASTDRTEAIAREWAAADTRVRYVRNPEDIGAAPNFHQCFRMARGRYFKWAAHDDLLHPKYLELCVEALEMSPEIVLAHTSAEQIDGEGTVIGHIPNIPDVNSDDPVQRFTNVVTEERLNLPIFGVMRSDVLATTSLHGSFFAAARVELAEMALRGPFVWIDDPLFVHRNHSGASVRAIHDEQERRLWYDPARGELWYLPRWEFYWKLLIAVWNAPLGPADRLRATAIIPGQILGKAGALTRDLLHLGRRLLGRMFGR
ncbi:MAG TPA: glycosyltransferase [Acidimicrobiia bacterium]|nr:glycosyltransferase [Acidimicrobiia bacterium]